MEFFTVTQVLGVCFQSDLFMGRLYPADVFGDVDHHIRQLEYWPHSHMKAEVEAEMTEKSLQTMEMSTLLQNTDVNIPTYTC